MLALWVTRDDVLTVGPHTVVVGAKEHGEMQIKVDDTSFTLSQDSLVEVSEGVKMGVSPRGKLVIDAPREIEVDRQEAKS